MMAIPVSIQKRLPQLTGFATLVILLATAEALIRARLINPYVVPLPSQVLGALPRIVLEESALRRFLLTGWECILGGLFAAGIGIPFGILLHRSELLRRAVVIWVAAFAAAPIVLAYPSFMVIFGRSIWTIVLIGGLSGLPPVVLKTLEGLTAVRPALIDVGRSLRLTDAQLFSKILFPAAMPSIFTGIRLGLIFSMINVVGVEFLMNFGGLGPLINDLAERYDMPGTYASIGFVVLVSILFFTSLEGIERWLKAAH